MKQVNMWLMMLGLLSSMGSGMALDLETDDGLYKNFKSSLPCWKGLTWAKLEPLLPEVERKISVIKIALKSKDALFADGDFIFDEKYELLREELLSSDLDGRKRILKNWVRLANDCLGDSDWD